MVRRSAVPARPGAFSALCSLRASGLAAVALAVAAAPALADPPAPPVQDWTRTETRADCTSHNPLRNPYFGDVHVHTAYSADAVLARIRNTPYDAYDYAKGGTVGLPPYDAMGVPHRLATIDRPLDFAAVTDHSEGFGEAQICLNESLGYAGYDDAAICQDLRDTFTRQFYPTNPLPQTFIDFFTALTLPPIPPATKPARFAEICGSGPAYADCMAESGVVWQDIQDAAEANYDRTAACGFTTFVAYEWSGQTYGNNLHRNIIFRNAEVPALPITYYEKWKAEDMRAELEAECIDQPGNCDVLAIPHNSNIAQDAMFSDRDTDGHPLSATEAAERAAMEPLVELTQGKGDSECRDGVPGTTDELCNFEKISRRTLQDNSNWGYNFSQYAYVRGGLKRGLQLERVLGVNPFPLGFIGSTDGHNGLPGAVNEKDYARQGQFGIADSALPYILAEGTPPSKIQSNPGGLAVVWAEENSRDAIFAAMRRRETYSTSGSRPILRVFGGRYPMNLCDDPNFVAEGYDKGVPMGGDLGPVLGKESPRFAVMASKDAFLGTPLQRLQMIKGWTDKDGLTHEQVYDIAGDANNGAGVDEATCNRTGTGADSLCTVWEDPEFRPEENAFYYVRLVENPVCRWSQEICRQLKTCTTHLTSCSQDPTRICTTNAECEAASPGQGSTCTQDYPAICTNDQDCADFGAGTCGSTLAVDCNNPSSLPPAAVECCSDKHPKTIQERAVASPIWYHPGRVGIAKGRVSFAATAGQDTIQLGLMIPVTPSTLDPGANGITFTLRDADGTPWTATIPAASIVVKKPGASWSYKDKTGMIGGITGFQLKVSSKKAGKIKIKTGKLLDLSTIARASQKLSLDVESGDYTSTADREWNYAAPRLDVASF